MNNLSESKLAIEESDVTGLLVGLWIWEVSVGIRQGFSELFGKGSPGFKGFEVVFLNILKIEVIDEESGRDDVILVDLFDEGLDSCFLDELLLVDAPLDSPWISSNAEDCEMRESVFLRI